MFNNTARRLALASRNPCRGGSSARSAAKRGRSVSKLVERHHLIRKAPERRTVMETALEYTWFYDALRNAASAISSTSSSDPDFDDRDPRFRNLAEAILYSRWLLLTYNAVLVVVIISFAVGSWGIRELKTKAAHQRRNQETIPVSNGGGFDGRSRLESPQETEGASSSGSSTLEGTESPPLLIKTIDEDTPLLHEGNISKSNGPWKLTMGSIKAFLIYQPSPIPFVNKTLPSNGRTIFIMGFIGLNIFYTLFHIRFDRFMVFILADRCGLVFVANLPLLYLLSAKTQPIKLLTGYSYGSLNMIHRRLGELLCFEALLHFLGMTITWYMILRPVGLDFWRFIASRIIILGLFAFLAYELIYFTSLGSFRQRWYELFLALHVLLQSAALVLVFFHHSQGRVYVGVALGIFLVDRLIYRLGLKSFTTSGTVHVMDDGETTMVSTSIPLRKPTLLRRLFGKSILNGWLASDHVFITVPSLGRTHVLQAHPFTIISPAPSPPEQSTSEPASLSLLIRSHATSETGFSASLLQHALQRTTLAFRLDGPYGGHHARDLLSSSSFAILIAGGSGIAVAWPLLNYLVPLGPRSHLNRSDPAQTIPSKQKIVLIWIVHSRLHESWLPKKAIEAIKTAASASHSHSRITEVEIMIPPPTEEFGRPDVKKLIRELVITNNVIAATRTRRNTEPGSTREAEEEKQTYKIGIVASGPDGMTREVRNTVASLVREGRDISVLVEKFGW